MQTLNFLDTISYPPLKAVYKSYGLQNFKQLPQIQKLSKEQIFDIEVVSHVLPFKTNNYVVEELIDWHNIPDDPLFILNFPQRDMLKPHHFEEMSRCIRDGENIQKIRGTADEIRQELNPHPAGQMEHNVPVMDGIRLNGVQHKYKETVLFFPIQGQTCHAYCSFCFRWPQFIGVKDLKFGMREIDLLIKYIRRHETVTDILFTGGDPLVMKTRSLASYINAILDADIPHIRSIRIGTKSLTYWPYRFITDSDSHELLSLFRKVVRKGKHLALMAHFNHPNELKTHVVKEAIERIRETGAQIRTQSPLLAHLNDDPGLWTLMWKEQVRLGCIPYYMFIARNTGAQHYFSVSIKKAWHIYQQAYQSVSGLSRTVRGPSMSAKPGKVEVLGVDEIQGQKVFVLRMLQGRNPDWVMRPFFAQYNQNAIWLDDLKPAFGKEKFFFEK
jgi:KamA family protein